MTNETEDTVAFCNDCDAEYGGPYFPDLVVPHDVWNTISPTKDAGGLLCPSCLCAAATKAGVTCKATFRSGPFAEPSVRADLSDAKDARIAELEAKLAEMLEVSKRAVRLSLDHPDFKLYAMEPMQMAIDRATLAELKGDKP